MKGTDVKQFDKIVCRFSCEEDLTAQIREFIITTMIPDEDVIRSHCTVVVTDKGRRVFSRQRRTRYFDVVFYVMYYQIRHEFIGGPVLEITYDAAWEITKEEYEIKVIEQELANCMLREAEEIINPIYKTKTNG